MTNFAIVFFAISEIILLAILLLEDLSGLKGFVIKLMAIIFPVILVFLFTERRRILYEPDDKHFLVSQAREAYHHSQASTHVSRRALTEEPEFGAGAIQGVDVSASQGNHFGHGQPGASDAIISQQQPLFPVQRPVQQEAARAEFAGLAK